VNGSNALERAVLEKLLHGDAPMLEALRAQARSARVSRETTGVGFFLTFELPPDVPVVERVDFELGDVHAVLEGLERGAGFVLFVRDGRLSMLEGFSYDEPWPDAPSHFALSYQREPRTLPRAVAH